jgi:hypothetical protein
MSSPDGLDLPAREVGDHHRHVRLAAGRREGGGDVALLASGRRDAEDQHVLGEPALVVGHGARDAQGEALLAEQRVAAVARPVRPDLPGLGEVDDVLVLGVAGPRHVGLAVLEGAPTECRQGTNSPSPRVSSTAWPMRVISFMFTAT